MSGVGKNGLDQPRMIQNGIANFRIAQKIDQRNTFAARAGERVHDEIKIGSGKPSPTIRPDHRNPIMSKAKATGKVCAENLAEGVGFEPTVGCPTLDFESSALNRTQPPFLWSCRANYRRPRGQCKLRCLWQPGWSPPW